MSRSTTRLRPLVALKAMRAVLRNAEDTRQVFIATRALRGRSGERTFRRFAASPVGVQVLAERRSLLARLSDQAALASAPPRSLAHAYCAFMAEEDLSAVGLAYASNVAEVADLPPDALLFRDRLRDVHDLFHVLTGYGRDPLGELCVLAVTYTQTRNAGLLLIVVLGGLRIVRTSGRWDVVAALREALRRGRRTEWLPGQDWEALLDRPLDQVRQELGVVAGRRYRPLAG